MVKGASVLRDSGLWARACVKRVCGEGVEQSIETNKKNRS